MKDEGGNRRAEGGERKAETGELLDRMNRIYRMIWDGRQNLQNGRNWNQRQRSERLGRDGSPSGPTC